MSDDLVDRARASVLDKFLAVSAERIERLNSAWIALERDATRLDSLEEAMRDIHTIKGESRIMGFKLASDVAHRTEDLLLLAKQRGFEDVADVGELLLRGFDLLGALLSSDPSPEVTRAGESFLDAVQGLLDGDGVPAQRPKGATPAPAPAGPGPGPETGATRAPSQRPKTGPQPAAKVVTRPGEEQQRRFVRVPRERLDHLTEYLGEVQRGQQQNDAALVTLQKLNVTTRRILARGAPTRLNWAELGDVQKRVSSLLQGSRDEALLSSSQLDEVDGVMRRIRLLPLSLLFARFERLVRDLAKAQQKKIRFVFTGGDLEADANVLDELAEPMMHLIQNCVDHGVETGAERIAAGKPEEAVLLLEARLSGKGVEITVSDDGRGIDRGAVARAAIRAGLVDADQVRAAHDSDVYMLIFAAGLSTRDEATELSGRGVGMDVVRRSVESLGGRVGVSSEAGRGTTFVLFVPTSVAVSRTLVVSAGGTRFGIPSHAVRIIAQAAPSTWVDAGGGVAMRLDDEVVSLDSLAHLTGAKRGREAEGERVIVVSDGERTLGLLVDRVESETQLVRRPLGGLLSSLQTYLGVGIGDNGEAILIVNLTELIRRSGAAPSMKPKVDVRAAHRAERLVMLVDDSEITRDMFERIVRSRGYRTVEAANGREALAKLLATQPDLIITDIEMPEMNGFELIAAVRRSGLTTRIPIIVLSSRGSVEDKERADSLGADAHLIKTDFSRSVLIETIDRFLQ